jgi:hypothetical protein
MYVCRREEDAGQPEDKIHPARLGPCHIAPRDTDAAADVRAEKLVRR